MIGQAIGKYRIIERLGTGGMGTVYKAFDETLERDVAIKVLNSGLADEASLKRFRAEATTLAKLNHPAIATIYDLVECDDERLIVLEFVHGETLEAFAERSGPLTPAQAVPIVDAVLSALAHTHRAGITHCDIKPANVMITVDGRVKVMDFGTARVQGPGSGSALYLAGTPAYMPPEQLLGQTLDGRTDVYAVGVLFYRLVTGRLPFSADNPVEAMRKQISDAPTPARAYRPDLPDWCDRLVQRALARVPADRFQTADEFQDALRRAAAPVAASVATRGRAGLMRSLIAATAAGLCLLTMTIVQAPSAPMGDLPLVAEAPEPAAALLSLPPDPPDPTSVLLPGPVPEVAPETNLLAHATAFAFDARVLTGTRQSTTECRCRVVLANGLIVWRAADEHQTHAVAFDRVASMAYSHGRDPLWMGPTGPTPVVQVGHGPLGAFGIFRERDWVSLRLTESRLRFLVLRFDEAAEAKGAINALEERVGLPIERVPRRRS
jgi:predicted Ser/Thr protein kinase